MKYLLIGIIGVVIVVALALFLSYQDRSGHSETPPKDQNEKKK